MKNIIDFSNKIKTLINGRMTNIANVEESPSTHPYTIGQQLIFNGLLCKATSAIAVGDTLAVGTNLALSDNVVEQIYSLNQGLSNSLANLSHENLLDNPWFTVNQRGQSTYSSNYGYCLDRWKIENQSLNVTTNSDGTITITNNGSDNGQLLQKFEKPLLSNMKGTLSIDVISYTGNVRVFYALAVSPWNAFINLAVDKTGIISKTENIPNLSSYGEGETKVFISLDSGASITVKSIKLETGSVSTLHMDSAPNYAEELLKCQRYFVRIKKNGQWGANIIGSLFVDGIIFDLNLASTMRANPTMSVISYGTIHTPSNDYVPTAIHVDNLIGNIVRFFASKPGWSFTNHTIANYEGVEFDLSADL